MIKFHTERNINLNDLVKILFCKQDLYGKIQKMYKEKRITLTNYGRCAFEECLLNYNISDCKVMVPAFICPVFYSIFKRYNITPVLIDVDIKTWNITPKTLKKGFDMTARCLITNDMNGLPCEIERLKEILTKDQFIIEDCSHSLGAKHNGIYTGSKGRYAFFSLYKNLPTISGGLLLTNDRGYTLVKNKVSIKIFIKLIYFIGKNANFIKMFKDDSNLYTKDSVYEDIEVKEINWLSKNIGSFYIDNLTDIIKKRKYIANELKKKLSGEGLIFQSDENKEHIYTYFSFLLPKKLINRRMEFLGILRKRGIVGRIIWNDPLINLYPELDCPNTTEISRRIFGIPINPNYSNKDINTLSNNIINALKEIK